uniref:Retrotransposon protein, putative, Ty3-gypsy subclass n=1 Tax=Macrostomum lignano TaxID=282301 RepID=A0A1I8JRR6_9PLAT
MHTQKPKATASWPSPTRNEAEDAMQKMNGPVIAGQTRSHTGPTGRTKAAKQNAVDQKPLNYDEVAQASSTANSTVYVGAITRGALRSSYYAKVLPKSSAPSWRWRVFKEKGLRPSSDCDTHEGAQQTHRRITMAHRQARMHGKGSVARSPGKCSWGKAICQREGRGAATLLTPYSYYAAAAAAAAADRQSAGLPGYGQPAGLPAGSSRLIRTRLPAAYPTASGEMLNGYATVSSSQLPCSSLLAVASKGVNDLVSMCTFVLTARSTSRRAGLKVQILRVEAAVCIVAVQKNSLEQRLAVQHEAAELRAAL